MSNPEFINVTVNVPRAVFVDPQRYLTWIVNAFSQQSVAANVSATDPTPAAPVSATIPWDQCIDPQCSANTNQMRIEDVVKFQRVLTDGVGLPHFQPALFDVPEAYDRIIGSMSKASPNSQLRYLASISKFLDKYSSSGRSGQMYVKLARRMDELTAQRDRDHSTLTVLPWDEIAKRLQAGLSQQISYDLRVMAIFMLSNTQLQAGEHPIGVHRPSDLIRTRFKDDGVNSYLDLHAGLWYIRSACTKNRVNRVIVLPKWLVEQLQQMRVTERRSLVMGNSSVLSKLFKRLVGVTFNEIRSSFVTHVHNTAGLSVEDLEALANSMGHQLGTAIKSYNRVVRR